MASVILKSGDPLVSNLIAKPIWVILQAAQIKQRSVKWKWLLLNQESLATVRKGS